MMVVVWGLRRGSAVQERAQEQTHIRGTGEVITGAIVGKEDGFWENWFIISRNTMLYLVPDVKVGSR